MSPAPVDVEAAAETARRAVEAAAEASLRFHRGSFETEIKADGSPVTSADRAAEAAILRVIGERFPGHAVLSEESGEIPGAPGSRWVVDPLDGTLGFSRGGVMWGPLVALEHAGEVVAGAAALPAQGEVFWAGRGLGAWRNGERLRVSTRAELSRAVLSLGEIKALLRPRSRDAVLGLAARAASTRCYGDVAGCALVLRGAAEVWLEAGVKRWDLAALRILVEEAGGRFTDFDGRGSLDAGEAIVTNGVLHEAVLRAFATAGRGPAAG